MGSFGVTNCNFCGRLISKKTPSCSCKGLPLKHGMSRSKTYESWESMKSRCNGNDPLAIKYYQEFGITYDSKWETFEGFFEDMGERPTNYTLDRIDVTKSYSKENCRWTTRSEQSFNTKMQRNNTSGRTGVVLDKRDNRWYARIDFQGKTIRLGSSKVFEEAVKLREKAEVKYFGYTKK